MAGVRHTDVSNHCLAAGRDEGAQACGTCSPTHPAQDYSTTAVLLGPLCRQGTATLRSAVVRIYLQSGHLGEASWHFVAVDTDTTTDNVNKAMNWAIEAVAYGQWDTAIYVLKGLLDTDLDDTLVCG